MSEQKSTYWEDRAKRLAAGNPKVDGGGQKAVSDKPTPNPIPAVTPSKPQTPS